MNKFYVFPSIKDDGTMHDYKGYILPLACTTNLSFVLFFPVPEKAAQLIDHILKEHPKNYNINMETIGIYKTMVDSWRAGGRFLSGIILDAERDSETQEQIISAKLVISSEKGLLDSIVKVNFVNAVTLAAMERQEILVSQDLLSKLVPANEENDEDEEDDDADIGAEPVHQHKPKSYPVDKDILEMAKKIMSGKVKDHDSENAKNKAKDEEDPKGKKQK